MISIIRKTKISYWLLLIVALLVFVVTFLAIPSMLLAQGGPIVSGGIVPCNTPTTCNYGALISGTQRLLTFLITAASMIAVILFVYAGGLLVFSGGNTGMKDRAKSIFWNTVIGLIIVVAAWLIVSTTLAVFSSNVNTPVQSTPAGGP